MANGCWVLMLTTMMMMTRMAIVSAEIIPFTRDCWDHFSQEGHLITGVHKIYWGMVEKNPPHVIHRREHDKLVFCDMETAGGGWTVIMRRTEDDRGSRYRENWKPCKLGFGYLYKNHWIGLEAIHWLTYNYKLNPRKPQELRIDLTNTKGDKAYALYDNFVVESEAENYKLKSVGNYSGTAGDSLSYHVGMEFSTRDRDNDKSDKNCAKEQRGGWWYKDCAESNLNFASMFSNHVKTSAVAWKSWKGSKYPLKSVTMMIRERDVDPSSELDNWL